MRAFRFDGEFQFHRSRFVLIKSTLRATPQFFRIFSAYCNRISLIRPIRVIRGSERSTEIRFHRKPSAQSLSKRKLDPLAKFGRNSSTLCFLRSSWHKVKRSCRRGTAFGQDAVQLVGKCLPIISTKRGWASTDDTLTPQSIHKIPHR